MNTKSVAQKLLIKPGTTLWLSHPDRVNLVGPLPDGVEQVGDPGEAGVALVFADDAATVRGILDARRSDIGPATILWVAYPKANRADINRDTLWPILAEYGLRPITQVAIDDVWSALRFRPLKEGEAPFSGGREPTVSRDVRPGKEVRMVSPKPITKRAEPFSSPGATATPWATAEVIHQTPWRFGEPTHSGEGNRTWQRTS